MIEIRDSSVHFYNENKLLLLQLEEVGHAVVQNFFKASKNWFDVDLSEYNFYLMPLGLHKIDFTNEINLLNPEEKNLIKLISDESGSDNKNDEYDICLNINIKFNKSASNELLKVALSNDPSAHKITLTDDQFKNKYQLDYDGLYSEMKKRYSNFKLNNDFQSIRKKILDDQRYAMVRFLDPGNPKSSKKWWYSLAILNHFDKHYEKKMTPLRRPF